MKDEELFKLFRENLKLDEKEYIKAKKRHNDVREYLKNKKLIYDSYLQGSFARKTMVPPLNDIDIVGITSLELIKNKGALIIF